MAVVTLATRCVGAGGLGVFSVGDSTRRAGGCRCGVAVIRNFWREGVACRVVLLLASRWVLATFLWLAVQSLALLARAGV